jgi:hypothetical protein
VEDAKSFSEATFSAIEQLSNFSAASLTATEFASPVASRAAEGWFIFNFFLVPFHRFI